MADRPCVAQDVGDRLWPLIEQTIRAEGGVFVSHADHMNIYQFKDGSQIGVSALSRSKQYRQQLAAENGGEEN